MNARKCTLHLQLNRVITWVISVTLLAATPLQMAVASQPISSPVPIPAAVQKILAQLPAVQEDCHVNVRKGSRQLIDVTPKLQFSSAPSDSDITTARIFAEPLIPLDSERIVGENFALSQALVSFKNNKNQEDVSALTQFIASFPTSRWRAALQLNLGLKRFETGYLSEALSNLKSAWALSKDQTGTTQKLMADRAIAEFLQLSARLGKKNDLEKYLDEIKNRSLRGSVEEEVTGAREGLFKMKNTPETSYLCGPYAVNSLLYVGKKLSRSPVVADYKCSPNGTNLQQCKELADKVGLKYQIAKRSPGASFITPSLMHWKVGHFCAVTAVHKGKYQLSDPTFDTSANAWISPQALEAESDGYFLVPEGPLPKGWQTISADEASKVWGRGTTIGRRMDQGPCCPATAGQPKCDGLPPCKGMPYPYAQTLNATLNMVDTPMSYSPPVGPTVDAMLIYKFLEVNQPSNFTFTNLGADWTCNWVSYLTLDVSQNATIMVRGGGAEQYTYSIPDNVTNPYPPQLMSQTILTVADVGVYKRLLPSGAIEVFSQPDGTGRIFMTQVIDPQGNSALIQYDSNFRITSVTDSLSQVTSFTYVSNTVGNVGFYKLSRITDPFGRFVTFGYDSTTSFLTTITDVVGNTSTFQIDPSSSFISALTTPYGTTSFFQYTPPGGAFPANGLRFTYPDGTSAVLENWTGDTKQTYYWDREATALYPNDPDNKDYTHCAITKFLVEPATSLESPVISSFKPPLEGTIVYETDGETQDDYIGVSNLPVHIFRLLDNGSTQNYFYEYNKFGKVIKSIDPVGRTFSYFYDANNIDLLEARQTRGTNNDLLGKWVFNNSQHVPNLYIDGSGQRTQYAYNAFGELTLTTDANSNIWTRVYDSNGYFTQIDGPLTGNKDVSTFGYDSFGRLSSTTDSEGYTLTTSFDALNRPTATTYPDGTTEQTVWNKLDAILKKDRIGRWTQDSFNSMDQMSFEIDPLGRKTQYAWCNCGSLATLTDPAGNVTTWHHDLEGRQIEKVYQDATTIDYVYENNTSRLKSQTDALNQTKTFSYNSDNSLAQKSYSNSVNATSDVNYSYDADYPRLATVQNGWGTITYSYNSFITDPYATPITGGGKLSSVTNNVIANSAISYSYDNLGRTTNRSINGANNSTTWAYDAMHRITSEVNPLGTFGYSYVDDQSGSSKGTTRISSISYPNSQVTNFGYYDNAGDQRLQQISNLKSDGTALSQFSYGYNSAGEITQWQQQQAGRNLNGLYGYDLAGQLTSVQNGNTNLPPAYASQNYYAYDSASNRTASQRSSTETVKLAGSITAGDVLTLTVTDPGLSTPEAINYTIQSGDTLSSAAARLAAAITANTNLLALGVNATSAGSTIFVKSVSANISTYSVATSGGATETITLGVNTNSLELVSIGGAKTTGDVLTIAVHDPSLSGGTSSASYTVLAGDTLVSIASSLASAINANANLSALGVTSTSSGKTLRISSNSTNTTTYTQTTNTGATETMVFSLSPNGPWSAMIAGAKTTSDVLTLTVFDGNLSGGSQAVSYTVLAGDNLGSITSALSSAVNANSNLQAIGVSSTANNQTITLKSTSPSLTSYRGTGNVGATETITVGLNTNSTQTAVMAGSATTGDSVSITVNDAALPGGSKTKSYVLASGNTLSDVASGLATSINGDSDLSTAGITANAVSAVLNISSQSVNSTTYTSSTSVGATETVSLANATSVTQAAYNNVNELTSTAAGGAARIEGFTNKPVKSATANSVSIPLDYSEHFKGNVSLNSGSNSVSVTATDGGNNTTTNGYALSVNNSTGSTLTYDLNGNMLSDGTNSYSWDAENRMIKITYPGSNNFSTFFYDGAGQNVSIVETTAGTVTSTKQFVWAGNDKKEERNGLGAMTKKFFAKGQINSTIKYLIATDLIDSTREFTDNSGAIQAQYSFDPYGRITKISEAIAPDFGYAGYYLHARSGLSLTLFRQYNMVAGVWLSRDPLGELFFTNLYAYVGDEPVGRRDEFGLAFPINEGNWCGRGWTNGNWNFQETDFNMPRGPAMAGFRGPDGQLPYDHCCFMHDKCLNSAGQGDTEGNRKSCRYRCDSDMVHCLRNNVFGPLTTSEENNLQTMINAFSLHPNGFTDGPTTSNRR